MKKLNLALIGKDVSKSLSPKVHTFISRRMGNCVDYKNISISETEFEQKIDQLLVELDGFNVTIPYKLSVIPHLKKVEGDGKVFGSVNTVTTRNLCGYNTDGMGFAMMLENNCVCVSGKNVLVLGAGGAGRSVSKKLLDGGAKVSIYDIHYNKSCTLAHEFQGITAIEKLDSRPYYLIVNATGVGMHETVGLTPLDKDFILQCEIAVDLIYTPPKTKFLEIAESLGKKIINGEGMLFYQAYFSECIYFDVTPNNLQGKRFFEEYQKEN